VEITVIVCTYNRSQTLGEALGSVASSVLPYSVEWEVLVVDNNSKDQTRSVVNQFSRQHPGRFRYLFEARQGKSHALNSGIREARGDVLAFVDDDVTVEPTWLYNLTASVLSHQWAGSGGRTLPMRPFTPPDWLPAEEPIHWAGILGGLLDLGDEPCELKMAPYGTNMAFTKKMFEKYGGFRIDLGPSPTNKIRNEDTELGRRLLAGGERLCYEPSAIVYHPILEERVCKSYFLSWWFDYGRALIREKGRRPHLWGMIPRHYFSIPKMIGLSLSMSAFRWMRTSNVQQRFLRQCWTWSMAGQIVETYHLAREGMRPEVASQETETRCDART
jgi:glucosyl-dolichyl phosphate glucuronosyltransferase